MSRDVPTAPARRFVPHRATLPLTTLLFLGPWMFSLAIDVADRPTLERVESTVAAPEVLGEHADRGAGAAWQPPVPALTSVSASPSTEPATIAAVVTDDGGTLHGLASVAATLASASSASVVTTPPDPLPHGAEPTTAVADHVAVGQAALARVAFPWQEHLTEWSVRFEPATGTGLYGLTQPDRRRIRVYTHDIDVYEVARVVAHELGHALDLELLDTGMRRAWKTQRGMAADVPWWPTPGEADFDTGAGDFAECFATLSVGSRSLSPYGACTDADLALLRELLGS